MTDRKALAEPSERALELVNRYGDACGMARPEVVQFDTRYDLLNYIARLEAAATALREEGEPEKLRDALAWCARQAWEGHAIEGYDFQDEMVKRGLMVEVPATEDFRDEWGADTMYVMAWSPLADPARHPHTEDESDG